MYNCENIFENKFAKILYYPKIDTIGHIWFPETTKLLFGKEYQEQIQIFMEFCNKHTPSQLLFDLKNGEFIIDIESQEWLQEVVYPIQKTKGVKRKAYIIKQEKLDVLSLSLKQTTEEDLNQYFDFKYFSETDEALQWLGSFVEY